jgi:hypothetical protein
VRAPFPRLFARRHVVLAFFAGSAIFGVLQLPELGTMSDRGEGIVGFELARTPERANEILTEWGDEGRSAARTSLFLDFPYLVFYGLFLAAACTAVARRAEALEWRRVAAIGIVLAWGSLLAAWSDAIENLALLLVLEDHTNQPWPGTAFTFAVIKFALAAPALLFAIVGWLSTAMKPSPSG